MLEEIIGKISELQSPGCKKYHEGLFPSQRVHTMTGYCREDNNIFFSALIAFTLKQLRQSIRDDLQPEVDHIIEKVRSNYHRYRHYADGATYNFWQDHPNGHFPNGRILKHLSFFALPADTDDTSMIYLTLPQVTEPVRVKQKIESHYAVTAAASPLTPAAYAELKAYPTFLGRKIKRELDACVICNVLYMVFEHGLPLTETDVDSIEFLRRVLHRRDCSSHPFRVSPNYGNCSVILYHMARLVGTFKRKELLELKEPLTRCLKEALQAPKPFMESLLIHISLLRLDIEIQPLDEPEEWSTAFNNFYFFQAGMLTGFQKAGLNKLAGKPFFHLKYRCEAYYWALWLEYKVLVDSVQFAKS